MWIDIAYIYKLWTWPEKDYLHRQWNGQFTTWRKILGYQNGWGVYTYKDSSGCYTYDDAEIHHQS